MHTFFLAIRILIIYLVFNRNLPELAQRARRIKKKSTKPKDSFAELNKLKTEVQLLRERETIYKQIINQANVKGLNTNADLFETTGVLSKQIMPKDLKHTADLYRHFEAGISTSIKKTRKVEQKTDTLIVIRTNISEHAGIEPTDVSEVLIDPVISSQISIAPDTANKMMQLYGIETGLAIEAKKTNDEIPLLLLAMHLSLPMLLFLS